VRVTEEFRVDAPKTKLLVQKVKAMGYDGLLLITDEVDDNLMLSSRNLPNVEVLAAGSANPVSLVRAPNVLITRKAVEKLEELLK
jgi:large subunit ribosomal protein L4